MSEYTDVLLSILKAMNEDSTYLFNLLEVLGRKKILNMGDLNYIKNHRRDEFDSTRTKE